MKKEPLRAPDGLRHPPPEFRITLTLPSHQHTVNQTKAKKEELFHQLPPESFTHPIFVPLKHPCSESAISSRRIGLKFLLPFNKVWLFSVSSVPPWQNAFKNIANSPTF